MSYVALNLDNIEEPKPLPAGRYKLMIVGVPEQALSRQQQKPMLVIRIGFVDHPEAQNMRHNLSLPAEGEEPSKSQFKLLMLKRFLTTFKIPFDSSGFNVEDFANAEGECTVGLSEPNEQGMQYNELVLPRLANEPIVSAVGKKKKTA